MRGIPGIDRDEVIRENRAEIRRRLAADPGAPEAFCVSDDRLDEALRMAGAADAGGTRRERVARAAAAFMGALAWAQPFCGANKYTAFIIGSYFIADSGYELNIGRYDDAKLVGLLLQVQEDRSEPEREAMQKLVLYIHARMAPHGEKSRRAAGGDIEEERPPD